jgi:N-acetylglucosaminyldiphosphoundecaprenol N-acetyl-beta-D-mannosaminyltransferase
MQEGKKPSREVLGMRIDLTTYAAATDEILARGSGSQAGYVCAANVHMVMEAFHDPRFQQVVNRAALVTPDGMPLVWALRLLGLPQAERVYGPILTLHLCEEAARRGTAVGFYGGSEQTLELMLRSLGERYPGLNVTYAYAPPFRPMTEEERGQVVHDIEQSGTRVLFVGLGCPKQERWMADQADRVRATMVGVGAAFDFIAGTKAQAPGWMQARGLEWVFRLFHEPGRLWRRYLLYNPAFVALFSRQLLSERLSRAGTSRKTTPPPISG